MRGRGEGQFEGYDTIETRKLIYRLLEEIGNELPEMEAATLRAQWLKRLIAYSENGFAQRMCMSQISPCPPIEAYRMFNGITAALGVPIGKAVELLEDTIRSKR